MKQFFKYVLATVTGLLIMGLLSLIITIVSLIGMLNTSTVKVEDNSVLVLKLNGQLSERASRSPLSGLIGNGATENIGLDEILRAIQRAKENDRVKGIYIEAGALSGASPAMLQEIRQALLDFKTSKKFIAAYGDFYTQGAYYISSVADSLLINPQGMIDWKGLAMQSVYYKDLLDKLGVHMEIFKVGTYKSAVEPYFLNEMSEANKEQITTFSTEIWNQMLKEVATSRKLTAEKLNTLADTAMMFQEATFYKTSKMVDRLAYSDEVPQMLCRMMDVKEKKDYNTISVQDLAASAAAEPKGTSGNIVAVYYASGSIVDEVSSGFSSGDEIASPKVIKDLRKLAEDDDVKAVVLRVNSPGGSAYASEQIWHEIMNLKAKKPVVVSMGGMAASGGYYISCSADWIVAEPTTLTGSIGIFGTFPVADELLNQKIGVHFQTVKTNKYADFGDFSREMNEGERMVMQNYVNRGYELFTKRCADGRKMKQSDIKKIAEGRVWSGEHAKQLGLVDQLGNLNDAIAVAKKRAKTDNCTVLSYPAKQGMFESLLNEVSGNSYADAQLQQTLGDFYGFFRSLQHIDRRGNVHAQLPYHFIFNL
ncbi:MAG: signal peptide peptidase SppA [Prevotellaceae bacterium]|nr:signal peptide peptidase SppA [Prevotellaceae bacterium]